MLQWCTCSPDPIAGGTSTSENGRIVGKLVDADGVPAAHAKVSLFPADFDPIRNNGNIQIDTTDTSGNYLFTDIDRGTYTIQSIHCSTGTQALRNGVEINDDTVTLTNDSLRRPGSIRIALPDSIVAESGYLYIPGTGIFVQLSGTGTFAVLDSVPAGVIPAVIYATEDTLHSSVLSERIAVISEDTVTIMNTGWKFNRRLRLNTTATGAGTVENVYCFPVLVRLTESNFDFAGAEQDGDDLLFTKPDGTVLPCEIERWDPVTKLAEVWVLVDTIWGNDNDNNLIMYWGNSRAGRVDERTVFDTAAGFSAVWHMNESVDTLYDATVNRCNGIRYGNVLPSSGVIGNGQRFDSSGAFIDMGNTLDSNSGDMTISAWVKRSTTGLQTIMAKSAGGNPNAAYGWSLSFGIADQLHFFTATAGPSWGSAGAFDFWSGEDATVTDSTTWHYVVAVFDRSGNDRCRTFIDGMDVTGGSNGEVGEVGSLVTAVPLRIGAEADVDYTFAGIVDECIVSHAARSEAWVRLCYVNQRTDDRLVEFEK
jgi:hypothetical protein